MGKRRQPIWVDRARTRTAADINDLDECQALLERAERDLEHLVASGAEREDAPHAARQALHYRSLVIRELQARFRKLSKLIAA